MKGGFKIGLHVLTLLLEGVTSSSACGCFPENLTIAHSPCGFMGMGSSTSLRHQNLHVPYMKTAWHLHITYT